MNEEGARGRNIQVFFPAKGCTSAVINIESVRQNDMTSSISIEPFERLIVSLRRDGLSVESDRLNDLIHKVAWTTGSEMIGELGLTVRKIKKENPKGLSDESKKNIRECLKGVTRIWPRFF